MISGMYLDQSPLYKNKPYFQLSARWAEGSQVNIFGQRLFWGWNLIGQAGVKGRIVKAWNTARCHHLTSVRGLPLLHFVLLHFCDTFKHFAASGQLVTVQSVSRHSSELAKLSSLCHFFICSPVYVTLTCLFIPSNRHDCWILRFADVWTIHDSVSLETFNNPYAPLGVTWDETRWVSGSLESDGKQNNIVSLKTLLPCLSWLHLLARLFAFFFFAHCHPPWFCCVCLPTLASSKHCQRFIVRRREREREWEALRRGAGPGMRCG